MTLAQRMVTSTRARLKATYPAVTEITWKCDPQIDNVLRDLPSQARICDLGAGGHRLDPRVITVDRFQLHQTDIVADLHELPLGDGRLDCVICTGTLEHVRDPRRVMHEISRVLKPGGLIYVEVPFMQGYHRDPTDYWRWTLDGLDLFCTQNGFEKMRAGAHMGPSSTVTWVLRQYALCFVNNAWAQRVIFALVSVILHPLKYLDILLRRNEHFLAVFSGVFFLGRKSGSS